MSTNSEEQDNMWLCAACGIAEVDDIKLKECAACDLVRYCSDKCQKDHQPQHKIACKKRVAELSDEILFKQPESSHHGDCPICFLPLPIDPTKSTMSLFAAQFYVMGATLPIRRERQKDPWIGDVLSVGTRVTKDRRKKQE